MNRMTTSPRLASRNFLIVVRTSTMRVAPSSQTLWQSHRSRVRDVSPAPSRPARRSAARSTFGGRLLATRLRSRASASKSVRTWPPDSTPQCGSIRNSRIPSSSWRSTVRRWFAMYQPGLSAAEKELCVPAKTTSLRRRSHRPRRPLQPFAVEATASRVPPPPPVRTSTTTRAGDDRRRGCGADGKRPAADGLALGERLAAPLEEHEQLARPVEDEVGAEQDRPHLEHQVRVQDDGHAEHKRDDAPEDASERRPRLRREPSPQDHGGLLDVVGLERGGGRGDDEPEQR